MRLGQRAADALAHSLGSWRFVIAQSLGLGAWIVYNSLTNQPVDPFPYILLNLALSTQAAFAAPVLQMSQNRADAKRDELLTRMYGLELQMAQVLVPEARSPSLRDEVLGAGELSEGCVSPGLEERNTG